MTTGFRSGSGITRARCHCWLAGTIAYFLLGMAHPRIQPIRPTWRKEPFDAPDWLFDLKYDGFRGASAMSSRITAASSLEMAMS